MIPRLLASKIIGAAKKMPVVAVTGPRQSGKSTLIENIFPDHSHANLEDLEQRRFALEDPKGFLRTLGERAVIDEVQNAPDLLSYIQVITDKKKLAGQYIISGSQNLQLMASVSQSLAGRASIFNLLPFSLEEIKGTKFSMNDFEEYIFKGFYPRIYDYDLDPTEWLLDYKETYVERDVRQIINVSDLGVFRQFLEICAGRVGQLVNLSEIGSMIGMSYQTVKSWIGVLETSFIAYRLRPYHKNYNKRIVKTPKLYFYDTGLACALLNIRSISDLRRHFAKGALFENFIINELLKNHLNRKIRPSAYFWNAAGDNEIDLLLEQGNRQLALEIKSGRTFHSSFFKGLKYFQEASNVSAENCYLVYGGEEVQQRSTATVLGWEHLDKVPIR